MIQEQWTLVDDYLARALLAPNQALESALDVNSKAGLPTIDVSPSQGQFIYLLAKLQGARRILEIGTLGGYSTICLARALPANGLLITLEAEPKHAEVARSNIERAGFKQNVRVIVGMAFDLLPAVKNEYPEPFDLIFIDADKPNTPHYYRWAMELARPGTVIVGDNAVRRGEIVNRESSDPSVQGMRQFIEIVGKDKRVEATGIQTVGSKGYDGFVIARVVG